jgi:hypothetical protein
MRFPETLSLHIESPSHPNIHVAQVTYKGECEMAKSDENTYIIDLPMLGYGYTDLFGIPIGTTDPERHEYVVVKENNAVIKKLSVSRVRKLTKDDKGAHLLRIAQANFFTDHWPLTTDH